MVRSLAAAMVGALILLWQPEVPAADTPSDIESARAAFAEARDAGASDRAAAILDRLRESGSADHRSARPILSDMLESLAGLYADDGRWADAETALRRALALREADVGPWHGSLVSLLDSLGEALLTQDRPARAEPLFRRSLAIRERNLGPDHPEVAMSLDDVAWIYSKLGRDADADALSARAESILARYGEFDFLPAAGGAVRGGAPDGQPGAAVERFPTVEAPGTVTAGTSFAVLVSLTEDLITPDVTLRAGPGIVATDAGGMRLTAPGADGTTFEAVLSAPGFSVADGRNVGTILLPPDGDSTPAMFRLTAEDIDTSHQARKLFVTLWRDGAYVAKVIRPVTVVAPARVAAVADPARRWTRSRRWPPSTPPPAAMPGWRTWPRRRRRRRFAWTRRGRPPT